MREQWRAIAGRDAVSSRCARICIFDLPVLDFYLFIYLRKGGRALLNEREHL